MSEELNNKDLFNLEDNDSFIGGDDDFDLPPLELKLEEDSVNNNIPIEPPAGNSVEIPTINASMEEQPVQPEQPKKESIFSRIFKKKEKSEQSEKEGFFSQLFKKKEKSEQSEKEGFFSRTFKKKEKSEQLSEGIKVEPAKAEKVVAVKPPKVKREKAPRQPREKKDYNLRELAPLFWTISGAIALLIAVILLIIVAVFGFNAVKIANAVNQDLVGQLYSSFVAMDKAHIQTTIPIESEVPAKFDLQLDTNTIVTLSEDVTINSATVSLSTGGLTISNAPTNIILPAGSELPIHLVLTVPVDEMIPVVMDVEVDIPMAETELHEPFVNLQKTIQPYYTWLWSLTTKGVSPMALPWNQ